MGQYQPVLNSVATRGFSALLKPVANTCSITKAVVPLAVPNPVIGNQFRTLIKFSARKGKRVSMKDVPFRFFRLHWGGWIRTKCGRHKSLYKKSKNRKHRLRQHVMLNAQQSFQMDKMVTAFWRRPKHYINDPYEPYHTRDYNRARVTPRPYPEQPLSKPLNDLQTAKLTE